MFRRFRLSKSRSQNDPESRRPSGSSTTEPYSETLRGTANELLSISSRTPPSVRSESPAAPQPKLGLHILHQPEFAALDIIFVHGLGGHSYNTWSKNHDPALFWPAAWLPFEPDVGIARILTYGYNADWRGTTKSSPTITDFAKELLYELRFAKDSDGADLKIGTRPIIFVVHSMGGLVVKKAYLLGLHDVNYKTVVASISAIIFLSTPHRGTNLADALNRIISATFQSSKSFISDLNKSSVALEELNEQFRHIAPSLSIWSFYETLTTPIGPKKLMVLEKDTSILGYPTEISKPLHADHQGMCKYSGPNDSNYISIRNAIKSIVSSFRSKAEIESETSAVEVNSTLTDIFHGCITTDDDYQLLRGRWIPNTCGWILEEEKLRTWISNPIESSILWYNAPPANGKSILSAYIINHLQGLPSRCQFFHFRYADPEKRMVSNCFRSLAFQLAQDIPEFGRLLCEASPETSSLKSNDPHLIWRNTFQRLLLKLTIKSPLYWVIDALDECDAPRKFLDCLKDLSSSAVPIRVLILSRHSESLPVAFDRLSHTVPVDIIEKSGSSHNHEDINTFVEKELEHIHGTAVFRLQLKKDILRRSEGNFLWTKLVLDEIMYCHTEEGIQEVFNDLPDDMHQLYQRMERNLVQSIRKSNAPLIKAIVEWSICAQRPLRLEEMAEALQPEFTGILNLRRTIKDACGQFVQVDDHDYVSMLHHTASEYFMKNSDSQFFVDTRGSHARLFLRTLSVLRDSSLRWSVAQSHHTLRSSKPFLLYSAIGWPFHLGRCSSVSSELLSQLVNFFSSTDVLVWVHILALVGRLDVLVKASRALAMFVRNTRKQNAMENPMMHRLSDLELLDDWIADLTRLVGKFGRHLMTEPEIIYAVIPALCPGQTAISRQFCESQSSIFQVKGNEDSQWNDNLGRFALPADSQAWSIICASKFLAVLEFGGVVRIWNSSNFIEIRKITHAEPVTVMALNENGTRLATFGLETTKIWSVANGKLLVTTKNPSLTKALALTFVDNDEKLLMGGDDNVIRYMHCMKPSGGWKILNNTLLKENSRDGTLVNSPMCLAFSADKEYVGVCYRGAPLSVWRLSDGKCIAKCKRSKGLKVGERRPSTNWFAVDRFTWNPVTGHVLGIYRDGCVVKWHPLTGEYFEVAKRADEIASSPDGKLFATSSSDGSITVWNFSFFTTIYKISADDLVTSLVFSPNSCRFYDLRGSVINAWEPDVIIRFQENEEHSSDTNSEEQSSTTVSKLLEEQFVNNNPVTALDSVPLCSGFCVGYEDGTVSLTQNGINNNVEVANFGYFLDVTIISWSRCGRFVGIANLGGDVVVREATMDNGHVVCMQLLPNPQVNHGGSEDPAEFDSFNVLGLIFSLDSRFILLWTESECIVCNVMDGSIQTRLQIENGSREKWICHPTQMDTVLLCGSHEIQSYSWRSLEKLGTSSVSMRIAPEVIPPTKSDTNSASYKLNEGIEDDTKLKHILLSSDSQKVMLSFSINGYHNAIGLCELAKLTTTNEASVELTMVPPHISEEVHVPLGVLDNDRFIFLNQELWVCSYFLSMQGHDSGACERFYFIPRDWCDTNSLATCVLESDGTLLWPRGGQVLSLKCDFGFAKSFPVI